MPYSRNLSCRIARPAAGNGRLQVAARRALWASDEPITTSAALVWAYPRRQRGDKRLDGQQYRYMRRALDRVADRIGHGLGAGRPWLWRLRKENNQLFASWG